MCWYGSGPDLIIIIQKYIYVVSQSIAIRHIMCATRCGYMYVVIAVFENLWRSSVIELCKLISKQPFICLSSRNSNIYPAYMYRLSFA